MGQVEGGGAHAPGPGADLHHRRQLAQVERVVGSALERYAGGEQAIFELPAARYPEPPPVEKCPRSFFGPEHFVMDRRIDDPGEGFAVPFEGDGDGEVGNAVEKIGGAVQGIDDPPVGSIGAVNRAAFLHQKAVGGAGLGKLSSNSVLGLPVGVGNEIRRAFLRHLQVLDLAEIPHQAARCLLRGGDHHVDQGGAGMGH